MQESGLFRGNATVFKFWQGLCMTMTGCSVDWENVGLFVGVGGRHGYHGDSWDMTRMGCSDRATRTCNCKQFCDFFLQ